MRRLAPAPQPASSGESVPVVSRRAWRHQRSVPELAHPDRVQVSPPRASVLEGVCQEEDQEQEASHQAGAGPRVVIFRVPTGSTVSRRANAIYHVQEKYT